MRYPPPTGINAGRGKTSIQADSTPRSPGLRAHPRLKSFLAPEHLNESSAGENNLSGVSANYLMTGMFAPIEVNTRAVTISGTVAGFQD